MDPARTIMEASSQDFTKAEDLPFLELLTPKWTREALNLVYVGPKYLDGNLLGIKKKSKLAFVPYNLCSPPYLGMNDVALKVRYMHSLQHFLTSILEKMEKYTEELSDSENQKLRRHVSKAHIKRLALLGEPCEVERKSFRRRLTALRFELHCDEREKRKRFVAREKKRRADHQLYLKAILNQSREFFAYHHKKVKAQAVKTIIDQRASKAEREKDRQEKLRLKALKANDMEEYGKLVSEAKNERLTYLLSQTNSYLDSIRQLIRQHKQKHDVVDEYTKNYDSRQQGDKGTNIKDVDDDLNYLEIASKGKLPRQPLMLMGGPPQARKELHKQEMASCQFNLSDKERMLIINRIHQVLRPFLLSRVKASLLEQLPNKVEKVLKCELS
ncbi:hypothetical protein PsorP6_015088 [Peronosclerospora sorghi]|uniref:Uncharacterized protein n=1 Tax=Peronosclerospora sorghi TaxID=230839 RepID=A0ACC0VT47_9STRA|nr:hypothetical protein PsorP6_015088 [Peronosclerospora sorghi]